MASPLYPEDQNNRHPGLYVYHNCQVSSSYQPSGTVSNATSQELYKGGPLRRHPSHQNSRSRVYTRSSSSSSGSRRLASRTSSNERLSSPLTRSDSLCRSYSISPLQLPPLQHGFDKKISGPWDFPRFSSSSRIPAPTNSLARPRISLKRPTRQQNSPTKTPEPHPQLQLSRSRKPQEHRQHILQPPKPKRTTGQQSQRTDSLNMDTDYGTLGAFLVNPFADPDVPKSHNSVQTESNTPNPRRQLRVINNDKPDKEDVGSTTSVTTSSTTSSTSTDAGISTAISTPPTHHSNPISNRNIPDQKYPNLEPQTKITIPTNLLCRSKSLYKFTTNKFKRERENGQSTLVCNLGYASEVD